MGMFDGAGGVGLTDVLTTLKNGVVALNAIGKALAGIFPQAGTLSPASTAAGDPAGYLEVTVNGKVYLVQVYEKAS